jgi:hypothetical protein
MAHILLLVVFYTLISFVDGVHFQGGTITWGPLNVSATGSPVTIVITQTYLWTVSRVLCTDAMIASNQSVIFNSGNARLNTETLNCISNCPNGSFSYIAPPIRPYCTNISASNTTITSRRSDIIDLTIGVDFTVAFQDFAWRPLTNIPSASWSLSMNIKLTLRSDNGLFNNAPIVTAIAPIDIPVNQSTVINIEVRDVDGDIIRCRWSVNSSDVNECGGACPPDSLPHNTIIYPNCTIIIVGENIDDWHAVTVMVRSYQSIKKNLVFFFL